MGLPEALVINTPLKLCLGACIVSIPEAEKVPSGPWNHRSLRGAFTLLGPDFIYQISL